MSTSEIDSPPNRLPSRPAVTQPELRPTIVLYPQGDLTLVVGDVVKQPFLVSRDAVRLASPVWNAMLGGRWRESGASEVALPDDDPEAMHIVLKLAHLKMHEIRALKICISRISSTLPS